MKNETDELLLELEMKIRRIPREQVAYKIIGLFTEQDNLSGELKAKYLDWLFSPYNAEAKEKALGKHFEEIFG